MKKIYTLVGCLMVGVSAIAQAPFHNATYSFTPNGKYDGAISVIPMHTRPDLASQDRITYFSEDFDGGLNGWVNTTQVGTAPFKLTSTGHNNMTGNTFIIPVLATSTPTQWIVLDSDADGTSYSNVENATLNSPQLDLTASAGEYIAIQFDQFFAEWDINTYTSAGSEDHCFIGVSIDSIAWTEVEINEGVGREGRPNPELVSWDISDLVAGNLGNVWIRFRWEGAWNYGWQFDNIEIVDIEEKDLSIMDTYRGYNASGLQYSMVPQNHATEFVIGAIIRNTGHIDQTNIGIDWEILDPSSTVVASGSAASTVTLANSEQDTFWVSTGFTPTVLGDYTINWTATSTEGDDDLTDNDATDNYYELTEYTYAQDFAEGTVEGISNWPLQAGLGKFGNLFSFELDEEVSAMHVKIASDPANVGELIYYMVYFNDGTAWAYLDESSDDYIIQNSDLGQIITLPIDGGIDVTAGNLYLFMVGHYATPPAPIFERQGDIGFSYIQGSITDETELAAFFDRKAPIVRIRVGANDVSVDETVAPELFGVYPNPANDFINVVLQLNESENTVINVLDITGQVVKTISLGTVNGEKNLSISLDEMSAGIYFIELVNAEGKQVKKFVKK